MIDHFNLPVRDVGRSRDFYAKVLAALGYRFLFEDGDAVGFGTDSWGFGIVPSAGAVPAMHLAFCAPTRAAVDAFFQTAIELGATSNGPPGIRSAYDPNYYAAFVRDPDGHNIEAVCRSG